MVSHLFFEYAINFRFRNPPINVHIIFRFCSQRTTHKLVAVLELLGIAASGSTDVSSVLMNAADALVEGGETGIFTPMFFILLRKPKDA